MYFTIGSWRFGTELLLTDDAGRLAMSLQEICDARYLRRVLFFAGREIPIGAVQPLEIEVDDE